MLDKLLTINDVADLLSVSVTSVRNKHFRAREGLKIIRVGRAIRFSQKEIEDYIKRQIEEPCSDMAESDGEQS